MTTLRTWSIELTDGRAPVTSNGSHGTWRKGAGEKRFWRTLTQMSCRTAKVPTLGRADLVLVVTPPDRRRRDEDNLVQYLLKPVKDGVVDAGVIIDDTPQYVTWRVQLVEPDGSKTWRYRLVLTELPALVGGPPGAPPPTTAAAPFPATDEVATSSATESHRRNSTGVDSPGEIAPAASEEAG